jgi:DNA processing protein
MEQNELQHYLALYFIPGVGAKRLLAICEYFGSAVSAFTARAHDLQHVPGMGKSVVAALIEGREDALSKAEEQLQSAVGTRAILTWYDEEYPEVLKTIFDPPALLFVDGETSLLGEARKVAVVGTRRSTEYGKRATREICEQLVADHVTVVSGFARGTDTVAHAAVYEFGGKTIAVLGSGIDVIYPAANKPFAKELIGSGRGLLVSELPFGTPPDARNFPWRNRIVSGLSKATVVIESDEKGGSMITASIALDQNRDVFALPGDVTRPASNGTNFLIRESRARLLRNGADLLEDLGWRSNAKRAGAKAPPGINRAALTLFENKIVDVLEKSDGPVQIDLLAERSALEVQDILVHLLNLEFKSIVRQMAGRQFVLVS